MGSQDMQQAAYRKACRLHHIFHPLLYAWFMELLSGGCWLCGCLLLQRGCSIFCTLQKTA
jgi:hypothetical protein